MAEILRALRSACEADLPAGTAVCVAFSGGLDSTVLLHGLTRLRYENQDLAVRALHVNHHLHANCTVWAEHCRAKAENWSVPLAVLDVQVAGQRKLGLEAAARSARYAALLAALHPDEALATAHQLDDQAETVLLRLLRGSGPLGLAGMAACVRRAPGWLWRPLLGIDRPALVAYARRHGLDWLEDPSNTSCVPDRNYLRNELLPVLRQRWPAASQLISRGAGLAAEASSLLDDLAALDLGSVATGQCLDCTSLRRLSPARARNVVRYFIRREGLQPPNALRLATGLDQLIHARADANPILAWGGASLRRYRGKLYLCVDEELGGDSALPWNGRETLDLGSNGSLNLVVARDGGLSERVLDIPLTVTYRRGGERLRRAGHAHKQSLKKLFQATGVPPWVRARIPLIYAGKELVAVADWWLADEFIARRGELGYKPLWRGHPKLS